MRFWIQFLTQQGVGAGECLISKAEMGKVASLTSRLPPRPTLSQGDGKSLSRQPDAWGVNQLEELWRPQSPKFSLLRNLAFRDPGTPRSR